MNQLGKSLFSILAFNQSIGPREGRMRVGRGRGWGRVGAWYFRFKSCVLNLSFTAHFLGFTKGMIFLNTCGADCGRLFLPSFAVLGVAWLV